MSILLYPPPINNAAITVNGRTYSSAVGVAIPVLNDDVAMLLSNGWSYSPSPPTSQTIIVSDTTPAVRDAFHVQVVNNPASPSGAIYPAGNFELDYPAGAAAVTGGGHMIGVLGRFHNYNTVAVNLGIGAEGKIDNEAGATIALGISLDANLGSNAGTITTWYGVYSDLASNAGTIPTAVSFSLNVEGNVGTINNLYGFYFPTLTSQNIVSTVIGYFFNNNPSITALKLAIYVADPTASILTIGPLTCQNLTSTYTLQLDTGTKTATATAGAATLNKSSGKITTESLTTAAGATYTLTLTNSAIAAADMVFVSLANGTNGAGDPVIGLVTPAAGSVTIKVVNRHASAALNGTLVISYACMKA